MFYMGRIAQGSCHHFVEIHIFDLLAPLPISGRLPFTIGKSINDYSAQVIYVDSTDTIVQIPYSEGLFIDYRHFDAVSSLFCP